MNRRQRLLTEDEYEVLLSTAEGEPVHETADRLGCSRQTIHRRRVGILKKLKAPTMAAAVARAFHLGILVVPGARP